MRMQIIFSVIIIIFSIYLIYKNTKNYRKNREIFEKEKNFAEKFSKNIFLESEFLKSEIDKKWFEILEIPFYKKIEFFKNIEKEISKEKYNEFFILFSIFYLFLAIFLIFLTLKNIWIFLLFIFFFIYIYFLIFKEKISIFFLFFWKNSLENISWIKSDFLIIFENEVLLYGKKFSIKSWDLTSNRELMEFLQKNENLEFYDFKYFFKMEKIINLVNKKYRIINNFQKNIKILDEKLENLENISKSLEKNISENEEFFHKSSEILKDFKILDKKILEIFNLKKNILENFEKITNDKNLDLKKFDFYVLEKVLNPILKLKNILQKNFENIEKMLLESKIEENHQIKFAEKRLEITKNNLKKQIIFLDEKLKFFEK